ncbi:hypothetical protein, partial [Bordetella bronchiseptica]|uniref:hypothetical protein n=1 Tax=Bordetella bronchiseptica TaxID=518 RepID=UPI001F41C166
DQHAVRAMLSKLRSPAPAPQDFVATELRGIIEVCGDSPTAIVSVERMRVWLSKLRAPVADERAAFAHHVSGRDDLEIYQVENVIDANLTRWMTWRAARDYYQQARAALASAPVADERRLRRMLCAQYAGSLAYMDDGEAQDARAMPVIDFLRDPLDEIERKMRVRRPAGELADPALQKLFGEAITGALGFGAQGVNPPPKGHWLEPFWQMARADATQASGASELLSALVDLHAVARVDKDEDYSAVTRAAQVIEQCASLASAPVANPIQWPTMPASKGQSPVLFEDGYAEGWAKCMDECRRAVSQASAPVADEEVQPVAPDDESIAEAWVTASDSDGIAYDGHSFERGYQLGEIAERDRRASAPVAGETRPVGWFQNDAGKGEPPHYSQGFGRVRGGAGRLPLLCRAPDRRLWTYAAAYGHKPWT